MEDINSVLYCHLISGKGAAWEIRRYCPNLLLQVKQFLASRTDISRLNNAQKVSDNLLKCYNREGLSNLRDIVAKQELSRLHNIRPDIYNGKKLLDNITLVQNPICYLSIFCDELQRWDRFAAGISLLRKFRNWKEFSLESHEIKLSLQGNFDSNICAEFIIDNEEYDVEELKNILVQRLKNIDKIISIKKNSEANSNV